VLGYDDPQRLVSAIELLDPPEFAVLFPALERVPGVQETLQQRWAELRLPAARFPPDLAPFAAPAVDPRIGPLAGFLATAVASDDANGIPEGLQRSLERFGGAAGRYAAVAAAIPAEEFDAIAEQLRSHGFRPATYRPSRIGARVIVSATWRRDAQPWRLHIFPTPQALQAAHKEQAGSGHWLVDFACVDGPEGEQWSGLWVALPGVDSGQLFVDEPFESFGNLVRTHRSANLALERVCARATDQGWRMTSLWFPASSRGGEATARHFAARYQRTAGPPPIEPGLQIADWRVMPVPLDRPDLVFARAFRASQQRGGTSDGRFPILTMIAQVRGELLIGAWESASVRLQEAEQTLRQLNETSPPSSSELATYQRELALVRGQLAFQTADSESLQAAIDALDALRNRAGESSSAENQRAVTRFRLGPAVDLLRLRSAILRGNDAEIQSARQALQKGLPTGADLDAAPIYAAWGDLIVANQLARKNDPAADELAVRALRQLASHYPLRHRQWTAVLPWPDEVTETADMDRLRTSPRVQAALRQLGFGQHVLVVANNKLGDTEPRQLFDRPLEDHARDAADLLARGWFPSTVVLVDAGDGTARCHSAWLRHLPQAPERERQSRALANLVVAMARLNDMTALRELLSSSPALNGDASLELLQSEARMRILTGAVRQRVPASLVADLFLQEPGTVPRRRLALMLGDYRPDEWDQSTFQQLQDEIERYRRQATDPAIKSAADWCARQWGIHGELPGEASWKPARGDGWFRNPLGIVMARVEPPREFPRGSPNWQASGSNETQIYVRGLRPYYLASTETTVAQFARFTQDHPQDAVSGVVAQWSPDPDCPRTGVRWFTAARFCQWLSLQAGVPDDESFYPRIFSSEPDKYLPPDHDLPARRGYRLPLEVEWEFACRGGNPSQRSYGESIALLDFVAWRGKERSYPVGRLRPNEFGFFDMLGNALEWCHENYRQYSLPDYPFIDPYVLSDSSAERRVVMRGGSFESAPRELRSADRSASVPSNPRYTFGFRVVYQEGPPQ